MSGEGHVDRDQFEDEFLAFKRFVEERAGVPLDSLRSHPYVEQEEGYKYRVYEEARRVRGRIGEVFGDISGAKMRSTGSRGR